MRGARWAVRGAAFVAVLGLGLVFLLSGEAASGNLVPNADLEAPPSDYYTTGPGSFTWATDEAHSGTHSLEIVGAGGLSRWMTEIPSIPVAPGTTYDVGAAIRTLGASSAYLSLSYWTAASAWAGTTDSSPTVSGTQDWEQVDFQSTAPAGAAFARIEVRLDGSGTLWADDLDVTPPTTGDRTPTIAGNPESGQVLVADTGDWSDIGRTEFDWQRCGAAGLGCSDIPGAVVVKDLGSFDGFFSMEAPYTLTSGDVGSTIRVRVLVTTPAGTSVASSAPTAVIAPSADPPWSPPELVSSRLEPLTQQSANCFGTVTQTVDPSFELATDGHGDDFAAWETADGIAFSRSSAGGPWSAPMIVAGDLAAPSIAASPDGRVLIAWEDAGGINATIVGSGAIANLSSGVVAYNNGLPQAVFAADLGLVVVWSGSPSAGCSIEGSTVYERHLLVGGWSPATAIFTADPEDYDGVSLLRAQSSADGKVAIALQADCIGCHHGIGPPTVFALAWDGMSWTTSEIAGTSCFEGAQSAAVASFGLAGVKSSARFGADPVCKSDGFTTVATPQGITTFPTSSSAEVISTSDGARLLYARPTFLGGDFGPLADSTASIASSESTDGSTWTAWRDVVPGAVDSYDAVADGNQVVLAFREGSVLQVTRLGQPAQATPQLAPDGNLETAPDPWYYTNGPGTFSWATDASHSQAHALKIVSTSSNLSRWLTNTTQIQIQPGHVYDVSAWLRSNGLSGAATLDVTYWTSSGSYAGQADEAPQAVHGTQDWTQASLSTSAPDSAASMRLEFRVAGGGTAWADDFSVTG